MNIIGYVYNPLNKLVRRCIVKLVKYFQYWAGIFIPIGFGLLIWAAELSYRADPSAQLVQNFVIVTSLLGGFLLWLAYRKVQTA